jgi:hypothetical protein
MNSTHSAIDSTANASDTRSARVSALLERPSSSSKRRSSASSAFTVAPASRAILRPTRSFAWMPVVPS